jgi:hypothetical protein
MFNKLLISITATVFVFSACIVNAHSPELHKKNNAEKPKCEAMNNMDHSSMDLNDPVMQAMMKQCTAGDNHTDDHQSKEKKGVGTSHSDMHKADDHHSEAQNSQ